MKEILEHNYDKKQKELENLLQTFRKRNEEYEKLLNETLMVNTKLFKQRRNKIQKVKKKEKIRFDRKLKEFLTSSRQVETHQESRRKSGDQSGFLKFIKKSLKMKEEGESKREKQRRHKTMKDFNQVEREKHYDEESVSTFSDTKLKTMIKTLNDPKARKEKFLKEMATSSEEDLINSVQTSESESIELKETKTFPNPKKNIEGKLRIQPIDYDYESYIIRKKKISDSGAQDENAQLKKDLLVTTIDYHPNPVFGADTPWRKLGSERSNETLSRLVDLLI